MADYGTAISLSRDLSHTSDDSSSDHSPTEPPSSSSRHAKRVACSAETGVEIQRKPRGRPPGSKNKPKPPIIITKDNDSAMKPIILEISAGSDIIDSIVKFARKNHVGISIISATGSVSNVTLRHPLSHAPSLSLHGPFNLLSLSGSFLGSFTQKQTSSSSSSSSSSTCSFGISLAGAQGQVFGGVVAGKVVAASQVVVVGATYVGPTFYKVASGDEEEGEESKPNDGGPETCLSSGMSMSVYGVANPNPISCQISPDIMHWGPPRPHY